MASDDLKMLFHNGFYDHPLDGLAQLNGEKVYFEFTSIDNQFYNYDYNDCDREKAVFEAIRCTYSKQIYSYLFKNKDQFKQLLDYGVDVDEICFDACTDNHNITVDLKGKQISIAIRAVPSYNLYYLEETDLNNYIVRHKIFEVMVGRHTNHDPQEFNFFAGHSKKCDEFYKNMDELYNQFPVNLNNKKFIKSCRSDDFKYYNRPGLV